MAPNISLGREKKTKGKGFSKTLYYVGLTFLTVARCDPKGVHKGEQIYKRKNKNAISLSRITSFFPPSPCVCVCASTFKSNQAETSGWIWKRFEWCSDSIEINGVGGQWFYSQTTVTYAEDLEKMADIFLKRIELGSRENVCVFNIFSERIDLDGGLGLYY